MFSILLVYTLEYPHFHYLKMTFSDYVSVIVYSNFNIIVTVDLILSQLDEFHFTLVANCYDYYSAIS